jgi:hypothetical protein
MNNVFVTENQSNAECLRVQNRSGNFPGNKNQRNDDHYPVNNIKLAFIS